MKQRAGEALLAVAQGALRSRCSRSRCVGITLQIDEGQEVFDAKHSTLHPLFARR